MQLSRVLILLVNHDADADTCENTNDYKMNSFSFLDDLYLTCFTTHNIRSSTFEFD